MWTCKVFIQKSGNFVTFYLLAEQEYQALVYCVLLGRSVASQLFWFFHDTFLDLPSVQFVPSRTVPGQTGVTQVSVGWDLHVKQSPSCYAVLEGEADWTGVCGDVITATF